MARHRDIGRKYISGAQKRSRQIAREEVLKNQAGSFEKYLVKKVRLDNEPREMQNESIEVESSSVVGTLAASKSESNPNSEDSSQQNETDANMDFIDGNFQGSDLYHLPAIETSAASESEVNAYSKDTCQLNETDAKKDVVGMNLHDPGHWPEEIHRHVLDVLVSKGPCQVPLEYSFPRNEESGRCFSRTFLHRILPNGEKVNRRWMIYSIAKDAIFCFCCKLFSASNISLTSADGFRDWANAGARLAEHEKSKLHLEALLKWTETKQRFGKQCAVDEIHQQNIRDEKVRWRAVFDRLLSIIRYLAEHNLAFRGSVDKLFKTHNGNFLGLVQLISQFDPVMKEHLRRIKDSEIHDHYLGKQIQNELINLMGDKVRETIVKKIKSVKYFAIILDCTPDISHQEQMSLVIRCVSDGLNQTKSVRIDEHFIKFLNVEETTGENLSNVLIREIKNLGLDFMNARGQGYDNGSNMKGHKSGVQARLLKMNPRAFFTPCACHSYNLLLGDMVKSCKEGLTFFGIVQRLYVLFCASTTRWNICRKFVKDLSPKPLSETRWECRVDAVKAIRYQTVDFYDALIELAEHTNDPIAQSEAESLAKELKSFKFLVALAFWYEILVRINDLSKQLQKESINLGEAVDSMERINKWLKEYRQGGFESAETDANEIANELETENKYVESRKRRKKRMSIDEAEDECITNARENFRINFFNVVIDQAISSLELRFDQLKTHNKKFGFINNFYELEKEEIKKYCIKLEKYLTQDSNSDIDGNMLGEEMEILKTVFPNSALGDPIKMLQYLSMNSRIDDFPNTWIVLRILLTIPVSVASGERSFSKLKLIKTYLRSTISQDRLNNLAILSIENETSSELDFTQLIDNFASLKARKAMF